MILFKNLVPVLFRRNCVQIRRYIWRNKCTSCQLHRLRNCQLSWDHTTKRMCSSAPKEVKLQTEDLLVGEEEAEEIYGDFNQPEASTAEMFKEIANGDPAILKALQLLEFEVAVLREEECRVPDKMTKAHWEELLKSKSLTRRKKYLAFLRLNELKRLSAMQKSEAKRDYWQKHRKDQGFHYYGLSGHTMFMRIYEKDINRLLINRLWNSNFQVVIDCSYQQYMSPLNIRACAKQVSFCFSESRLHRYPCQIHLCNLDREDDLGQVLPSYINSVYDNFYGNLHRESYLDLFPKEKLVYLTPHTNTVLDTVNMDDIYIIGGFVDKGTGEKASLAKAKEQQLRMAKIPLDQYLVWKKGTKSLPINTVLTILLDMAFYSDWRRALQNVPTRCLTE